MGLGAFLGSAGGGAFTGALGGGALGLVGLERSAHHQRKYAKNKHQWEVADLRAAGLNPILSATGSSSSVSSPSGSNIGTSASSGALAGIAAAKGIAEVKKINADTALTNAQTNVLAPAEEFGKGASEYVEKAFDAPGVVVDIVKKGWGVIKSFGASAKQAVRNKRKIIDAQRQDGKVEGKDYWWDENGQLHIRIE